MMVATVASEARKYHGYALECVRLAGHAEKPEARDKLLSLARVWRDAALIEEKTAAAVATHHS
jgi:hypothetical protein